VKSVLILNITNHNTQLPVRRSLVRTSSQSSTANVLMMCSRVYTLRTSARVVRKKMIVTVSLYVLYVCSSLDATPCGMADMACR